MAPKDQDQDQPKPETEEEKAKAQAKLDEEFRQAAIQWQEYIKTPEGKKEKERLEKALKPFLDMMYPHPDEDD